MLELVTITGADDKTSIDEMAEISKEYPWVEWGILVSLRQEGCSRFPSRNWIARFVERAVVNDWHFSTHICGAWIRHLFVGALNWASLPPDLIRTTRRIQLNTHAEQHVSTVGLMRSLAEYNAITSRPDLQIIFQWDGVNDHLAYAAKAYGLNVCALFDTSHGAGQSPEQWPQAKRDFWCGYAGGLGPENIRDELPKIERANIWPGTSLSSQDYWIDMERRVRTDHEVLDTGKVRTVLDICKAHRAKTIGKSIREEINRG